MEHEKKEELSPFDIVMEKVGTNGKFQREFSYIFNVTFVMVASIPFFNVLLTLAIPDHWCNVPGRNLTNYTVDEWKNLVLPKEVDAKGKESVSKCRMYNITDYSNLNYTRLAFENYETTECQFGWDFDRTWYLETIPSEGEWVCEKELFVSNAFAIARIGDLVGTFIFGQLGDIIGRQPVFFLSLISLLLGRIGTIISATNYTWFLFVTLIGNFCATAVFQAPLIISIEMSEEKTKSQVALMQCVAFTVGFAIMPFIFWFWGHWYSFAISTVVPCFLFLLAVRYMIESPRWLADKGKYAKCIKQLEHIAKINGTKVPEDALIILQQKTKTKENAYGIMSLFSSWRLAKNTLLLLVASVKDALLFGIIILNITNLGGNPFLNIFINGISEIPAFFLSRIFCDKYGRRWTQVVPNLIGTVGAVIMIFLIADDEMAYVVSGLAAFIKFLCAFVYYATNLQCLEMYPTCVRQSGLSLGFIIGNVIGVFVPYLVFMGTAVDARYPIIIIAVLSFFGSVSAAFLPETLYQKLPETLAEAHVFGADQKFWSWPKKPNDIEVPEEVSLKK